AVVEGEGPGAVGGGVADQGGRCGHPGGDGVQMPAEVRQLELVGGGVWAGQAARVGRAAVEDVVVEERERPHGDVRGAATGRRSAGRRARRCQRSCLVSQGWPHSPDARPLVSIRSASPLWIARKRSRTASRLSSSARYWMTTCDSRSSSYG